MTQTRSLFLAFLTTAFLACGPTTPTAGTDPKDGSSSNIERDAGRVDGDDAGSALRDDDAGPETDADAGADVDPGEDADGGPVVDDDAGAGEQTCPAGYTGATCDECAVGYASGGAEGECLLSCEATGELALDCSGHGECAFAEESGERACECYAAYEGDSCEACAPGYVVLGDACVLGSPPDEMLIWLDAADFSTLELDEIGINVEARVTKWNDKRNILPYWRYAESAAPENQPIRKLNALNGLPVVRFDGVDDFLIAPPGLPAPGYNGVLENAEDYTVFLVGYAKAAPQVFLAGVHDDKHGLLVESAGLDEIRFLHRMPLSSASQPTEDNLATTQGGYSRSEAQLITVTRDGDTHAVSVGVGDAQRESFTTTAVPFDANLTLLLGRIKEGATGSPRWLAGDIAEVIVYTRALSDEEITSTQEYLTAKWGLDDDGSSPVPGPGDGVAPTVVTSFPGDGDVGVTTYGVEVTFSEPMDTTSLWPAVSSTSSASGYLSWNDERTVVHIGLSDIAFAQGQGFDPSVVEPNEYELSIGSGVRSAEGIPLAEPFTVSFKTARLMTAQAPPVAALTRTMLSSGVVHANNNPLLYVGDSQYAENTQMKAFLSFDFSALPENASIYSGYLRATQSGVNGDPYGQLGVIELEHMSFDAVDADAFDAGARASLGVFADDAGLDVKARQVTAALKDDFEHREARGHRTQYRLSFSEPYDEDSQGNSAELSRESISFTIAYIVP